MKSQKRLFRVLLILAVTLALFTTFLFYKEEIETLSYALMSFSNLIVAIVALLNMKEKT